MQEDFLCSPINRQVGCKQFTSNVVGGPATTILPVCSVFLCNDNCTTGNLTYQITPLEDYYGKRLVIIKTLDTTGTGFKVRLTSASANFVSNGSATLGLPDLPSTTELIFPIGPGGEIGVSSYDSSSGGAPVNIYNTDGTLTGVRTVNLDDQILRFQGTGNDFFQVEEVGEIDITSHVIAVDVKKLIIVPQFPLDNTVDDIVVQESGTGQIKRRAASTIGSAVNIYNTNGTLTSARTLSMGGFNLSTTGTGQVTFGNSGTVNLNPNASNVNVGTALSNTVNIGRLTQLCNLQSSTLRFSNLSAVTNPLQQQSIVLKDAVIANNNVSYVPVESFTNAMFSMGSNPGSGVLAIGPSTTNITNLVTTNPTNHPGYSRDPGVVTTVTGVFTVLATNQFLIVMKVDLKNSASNGRYTLQLYNNTGAVVVSESEQFSPITDQFNTCQLVDTVILNSASQYVFRIINQDTAGVTSYQKTVISVNRI